MIFEGYRSGWGYNDRLVFVLIPSAFYIYLQSGTIKMFTVLQLRTLTTRHKRVTRYLLREVQRILEKGDRYLGDIQCPDFVLSHAQTTCMHCILRRHTAISRNGVSYISTEHVPMLTTVPILTTVYDFTHPNNFPALIPSSFVPLTVKHR